MRDDIGILLAGGNGTRLHPITRGVNKHLLAVYDKPMIYYSLSILLMLGVRKIVIIHRPGDYEQLFNLLGDGSEFGCNFIYQKQHNPGGIAEGILLAQKYINQSRVKLVLGDNLFIANELLKVLEHASKEKSGCTLFSTEVSNPSDYGVIKFKNRNPVAIIEKPKIYVSNSIVTGLYFYDETVVERANSLFPSTRGELEITDLNNTYMKENQTHIEYMGRGVSWFDTGSVDQILNASTLVKLIQENTGHLICSPHEIAYTKGFIDRRTLSGVIDELGSSVYRRHLETV